MMEVDTMSMREFMKILAPNVDVNKLSNEQVLEFSDFFEEELKKEIAVELLSKIWISSKEGKG